MFRLRRPCLTLCDRVVCVSFAPPTMSSATRPNSPSDSPSDVSTDATLDNVPNKTTHHTPSDVDLGTEALHTAETSENVLQHGGTSDDDIGERIASIVNYLKVDTLYLPLQSIRKEVGWKYENRSHRLVVKGDASGTSAILTLVAVISTDSFFLTPDAYYKGANSITASLADVKLSCIARRPVEAPLASDFASALANLLWLMEQVRSPGLPRQGVTMPSGAANPTSLKLRHVLFKVSCHHDSGPLTHRTSGDWN